MRFDYSDIRPKGARLVTSGGRAPGPQPLKECLVKLQGMFEAKENGDKLSTIEVHDMICYIADAVLAGGIRRAALISLFSADDSEMISSKTGNWWEKNPQRGRANNSVVLMRHIATAEFFKELWEKKAQWQVWFRMVLITLLVPFIIVAVIGKRCDRLVAYIDNNTPKVK